MSDVVITGAGAATPFGRGVAALHEGMLAGQTCIAPIEGPRGRLRPGYGAVVQLSAKDLRALPNSRDMRPGTMTRYTFLSTLALGDCMADGDTPWDDDAAAARERGLYVASYTNSDRFDKYVRFAHFVSAADDAGNPTIVDGRVPEAIRKFSGFEFLKLMNNMPTAHGGIQACCQGPCNTFLGTPSGGLQAIGRAREAIVDGLAKLMYAGGVGSSIHDQMMMVRAARGLAADPSVEPARAARPFDQQATGIVPGEAGGMLVLETREHAEARGARIRATLAGYGEWFEPPVSRDGVPGNTQGLLRSAGKALAQAGLTAADIDLVVAHGEGRIDLDTLEAQGLAELFGERAAGVPVLSTTAHLGAIEAAAGPVGCTLALACMETGKVPGALNREQPLEAFRGPHGREPLELDVRNALVALTTREGVHAAVVLTREG